MEGSLRPRRYRRMAPGARLQLGVRPLGNGLSRTLDGSAENISLGGMFIATDRPYPRGETISVEFRNADPDGCPVRATAIVRWRRRVFEPRGMGVEFLEFEGIAGNDVQNWLDALLEPESKIA